MAESGEIPQDSELGVWDVSTASWSARIRRTIIPVESSIVLEWISGELASIPNHTTTHKELTFSTVQIDVVELKQEKKSMRFEVEDLGDGRTLVQSVCLNPLECADEYRALYTRIESKWKGARPL